MANCHALSLSNDTTGKEIEESKNVSLDEGLPGRM
jgi:hypothetical protein